MKKQEPKKSKKPNWSLPHRCISCGKTNSGYLLCPYCGKISMKGGEKP